MINNTLHHGILLLTKRKEQNKGTQENSFPAMAKAWSAYLQSKGYNVELCDKDVQLMMVMFKIIRCGGEIGGYDSYLDACVYAALAGDSYINHQ